VARSEGPGKGSEFIVRLPAFADERAALDTKAGRPAPAVERRKSDGTRFRILVVDDHHDAGDSLATLLRLLGHEVRVAYDGKTGIEIAKAFLPEAALLDIGMPGMDGIELGSRLRAEPSLAGMLLIALTGYGRDEDRRRSADAGFDAHLVKPVDVTALNGLLDRHRHRDGSLPRRGEALAKQP
jgi:CheY-like chemotaxis protein